VTERVTDLTAPPVVGKRYLVPCIKSSLWARSRNWLPVTGPVHLDEEIGVIYKHWHFDLRFLAPSLWERLFPIDPVGTPYAMKHLIGLEWVTAGPEERAFRCHREQPEFPMRGSLKPPGMTSGPVTILEPRFRNVRLKPGCLTCPHRGAPLGSLPRVNGSVVVCALHGLAWDLATGRMVPRAEL
jgi:hypothetical protein